WTVKCGAVRSTQRGIHTSYQLTHAERFCNVIVGPHVQAEDFVCFVGSSREHQYRNTGCRGLSSESTADLKAVHTRQIQIKENQTRRATEDQIECVFSGHRDSDAEALTIKVIANRVGDVLVIFDDDYASNSRFVHPCNHTYLLSVADCVSNHR